MKSTPYNNNNSTMVTKVNALPVPALFAEAAGRSADCARSVAPAGLDIVPRERGPLGWQS